MAEGCPLSTQIEQAWDGPSKGPETGQDVSVEPLADRIRALVAGEGAGRGADGPFLPMHVAGQENGWIHLIPAGEPAGGDVLAPGSQVVLHYHDETGLYLALGTVKEARDDGLVAVELKGLTGHQRRREARRKAELPARYKLRRVGELALEVYEWQPAMARDISRSGLSLEIGDELLPGDHLMLELNLGQGWVSGEGRVTRIKAAQAGHRAGVRFTALSPETKEAIGWFVLAQ